MSIGDYITNLSDARRRDAEELKGLYDAAVEGSRSLSGEEREKEDRLSKSIDEKHAEIERLVARERTEREAETAREAYADVIRPVTQDTQSRAEVNEFAQFLRGNAPGRNADGLPNVWDFDLAPVANERAMIRAGADAREIREARTNLNVGTTTAGGYTVPTDLVRTLYNYLENVSGVRQAGPTIITTSAGNNTDLPIVTAHGSAAIVGEGTALAAADPAFTKITLGAYKYGQLLQATHELLQDTAVPLEAFLGQDFGMGLGRATETHYVRGSGTNQPQGAFLAATVGTGVTLQTTATGVPSYSDLVSLVYSVENIYRDRGAAFFMQDSFVGVIRKLRDSNGLPLWNPGYQVGLTGMQPDNLLGFPIYRTPFLSAVGTAAGTPMAFGNVNLGYVIRDAGSVRIERSVDFAFSTDVVTFRAILRTDGRVRDAKAIKVALAPTT